MWIILILQVPSGSKNQARAFSTALPNTHVYEYESTGGDEMEDAC